MSRRCMYCGSGPAKGEASSVFLDFGARGLAVIRTVQEMRSADVGWRQVAAQVIGRDDAPELANVPRARLCPYCRKTHMTALGSSTLWTDFAARLFGLGQGFIGARSGGLRGLAAAMVDGDDARVSAKVVSTPQGEVYEAEPEIDDTGRGRWPRRKKRSKRSKQPDHV